MLAATALFVIADITLRQFGRSLGGSDELSGYAMAITASWGLGYALLERAHVRIDLVHRRLPGAGRAALDIASIAALAATAALVAFQCWPVLEKSLSRGSRANTPLETPLWIPQSLWFGGWLWFAGCAVVMLVAAVGLLANGRRGEFDDWFGASDEGDAALREASLLHGRGGSGHAAGGDSLVGDVTGSPPTGVTAVRPGARPDHADADGAGTDGEPPRGDGVDGR